MPVLAELIAAAGNYHRAGRPGAAEEALREAVALDPGCGPALHLLGVLAYDRGSSARPETGF